MVLRRHILDWSEAALPQVAQWLVDQFEVGVGHREEMFVDMGGVLCVLPGRRAGRRLEELLIDAVEECGGRLLSPPVFSTGSKLVDLLLKELPIYASDIQRRLAWIGALKGADEETVDIFLPHRPHVDDLAGWLSVAEQLDALHAELAGAGLDFAGVVLRAEGEVGGIAMPEFKDGDRWRALSEVRRSYLEHLASWDVQDRHEANRSGVSPERIRVDRHVVLIGAVDLNAIQRNAVRTADHQGCEIDVLVHADKKLLNRFDEMGCIRVEAWVDAEIDIDDGQIMVADRPVDQGDAVVATIAELNRAYGAEEITIGICQEEIVPQLEQHLSTYGLPVRFAAGPSAGRTAPARFLGAVANWLSGKRFSDFATLLRHPDVERWLTEDYNAPRNQLNRLVNDVGEHEIVGDRSVETLLGGIEDWLSFLDRYYQSHLLRDFSGEWLGDSPERERLKTIYDGVRTLLAELDDVADHRAMNDWAERISIVLTRVYGEREFDRRNPGDRIFLDGIVHLSVGLEQLLEMDERCVGATSASNAIRLLLRLVERQSIPPEPVSPAIEMLGQLELALDDAPVLIMTGFNDGNIPQAITSDVFLPNGLRRHLGLVDNEHRYARDAYALSSMLASKRILRLIAGRSSLEGDPLKPSRLLFACDEDTLSVRVERFFGGREASAGCGGGMGRLRAGKSVSDFAMVPEVGGDTTNGCERINALGVTRFADYLACPYRFYLSHVLHLKTLDDVAEELDGAAFGNLAHDVLSRFGSGHLRETTHIGELRLHLDELLDDLVILTYGRSPLAAVCAQVEQLRRRLYAFANWQCGWAKKGWEIRFCELTISKDKPAPFVVDGEVFHLHGRIDRIDYNPQLNAHIIFDYKTGDSGDVPSATHKSKGEWVNLQLPLYRHLAKEAGITGDVGLGYILLPKDVGKIGEAIAEWDGEDLKEADERAWWVVRQLRQGVFGPPADPPPSYSEQFAAICREGYFGEFLECNDLVVGEE